MKKRRTSIIAAAAAVMIALCSGCGLDSLELQPPESTETEGTAATAPLPDLPDLNKTETTTTTTTAAPEPQLEQVDPFDGLEVQFDGISPYINVTFNNSKCRREVQEHINFTYDQEKFKNIANGDKLIVKADYNIVDFEDTGIEIACDEKEYEVSGMPYYVEDFSAVDCSALDTEIQQFMDSHYLYSDKDGTMMEYKEIYGSSWPGKGIMGVELAEPIGNFHFEKMNESNAEKTYSLMLKPNFIADCKVEDKETYYMSEKNTFNYYFKQYKNTYTVRENNGTDTKWDFNVEKQHTVDIYACIFVKNIIANPDGTLRYDKLLDYYTNSAPEQAYFEAISSKGDKYNITEVK